MAQEKELSILISLPIDNYLLIYASYLITTFQASYAIQLLNFFGSAHIQRFYFKWNCTKLILNFIYYSSDY